MTRQRPERRRSWTRDFIDELFLKLSRSTSIDGLWVGAFEDKAGPLLPRLEEALGLIRTHDPVNYRRVTRDLERVWVNLVVGSPAIYRGSIGACQLDARYVRDASTQQIASTIVHEATHARLARCGIVYDEPWRVRSEAACIRRQLAFTAKLPDGDAAHKEAQAALAGLARETYTDQAFRARDDRGSVEAMRYLGLPEWFIRAMFRLRGGMFAVRRWFGRAAR